MPSGAFNWIHPKHDMFALVVVKIGAKYFVEFCGFKIAASELLQYFPDLEMGRIIGQ